jgi:Domain of Unknown Function (DUF928)
MFNFQSVLMGGLVITAVGMPQFPVLTVLSSLPDRLPDLAQSPRRSRPVGASTATAVNEFIRTFNARRARTPGLSRSGGFCPISPGLVETDQIWSDRPLFLWRGTVAQIQLRKLGSPDVLWSQTLTPQSYSIAYSGAALQPGEIYQWELLGESNANAAFIFQVMEIDQRSPIAAQLQEIAAQMQASGATEEAIALQQAQYFADQNLWSDALQLLYSIKNPSPGVHQAMQDIENSLCTEQQPSP